MIFQLNFPRQVKNSIEFFKEEIKPLVTDFEYRDKPILIAIFGSFGQSEF